jgi:hypothetical protein
MTTQDKQTQLSIWNVGAIIDRPWIFLRKIHRRKAARHAKKRSGFAGAFFTTVHMFGG